MSCDFSIFVNKTFYSVLHCSSQLESLKNITNISFMPATAVTSVSTHKKYIFINSMSKKVQHVWHVKKCVREYSSGTNTVVEINLLYLDSHTTLH